MTAVPAPVFLSRPAGEQDGETSVREQLDQAAVAARLGVTRDTIRRYRVPDRAKYGFPAPDGYIGRTPWWFPSTIDRWARQRPGQGAGAGRPRKAKP